MSDLKISPELLQISPEVQAALKNKPRDAVPTKCPDRN